MYLTTGRSFPLCMSGSKPGKGFLGISRIVIGSRKSRSRGCFRCRESPSGTFGFRHVPSNLEVYSRLSKEAAVLVTVAVAVDLYYVVN